MIRTQLLRAGILAALVSPVLADEANLQPEVVVTASRAPTTTSDTLADVSVITREDIDASGTHDLSDLLRLQAGVDIARTGGPGSQTSLFLRGTNNNHVLVLVDGVRVAALGTGAFTWETLPLDTVERIEIVRGPRASYWGSDAIGGVVQIFTRKLGGPRVALGFGTYGDRSGSVGYGHRTERGGFSVQFGTRDVDGFPSQNENGFGYEPKDHGFDNRHLSAQADTRLGAQTLSANFVRSEGTTEFSGGESDFTQQAIGTTLEGPLGEHWKHRLSLGQAREDYATPVYFSAYASRRTTLGWQHDITLAERQRLTLGIDHVRERGENRDTFGNVPVYREHRDNTGLYAGWQGGFGALDAELAARHDDNSEWDGHATGSAALGWRFAEAFRAWASHGQGFRGPTLNEQYSPGFGGLFAGNPDLQPEESRSNEIGLEFTPADGHRLAVNAWRTHVRNLISFSGVDFQAENVARAKIRGSAIEYDGRYGAWQVGASFTWQDPRNADTDALLLRRAKHKATAIVERRFGDEFSIGAEMLRSGRRADVGGIELSGYTLFNIRASWWLSDAWRAVARVENATDRGYELARGYNTPGRAGHLEVIWSPR
ncbi:MAG TPA: TonB-dependent receptor [Dokdonella sp.]|uniref:TonB-dependent receptor domain-containing protein n=1 Tax=Dokdonella sp. TaxID=2291710 RepID=UPI0025BDFCA1|nr:TonB-dependent receptor [Dokdonella sp.]MBX3690758.1 TonB-dependent receptor [Dokdonella sp.]MCW5568531.1 TonB-dependent receptor [Dokdonella sp.]HNR91289.1 TonB-dependent receptor [Dokdonella sp.]